MVGRERVWVLLLADDDLWHCTMSKAPSRTRCGQPSSQVRRVSNATPRYEDVCKQCGGDLLPAKPGRKPGPSKAVRKKMAELIAQGVRADVAEGLAVDALSRADASRSVRAVGGGLPTLGKRR